MSAPIRNPRDFDDPSIYAPRWLRESPSPPLADAGMPRPERLRSIAPADIQPVTDHARLPRDPDPARLPQDPDQARLPREMEAGEGDLSHHLLMHQALRPQFLPEPPMPQRGSSFVGAAARVIVVFAFVAGAVFLFIFGVLPYVQLSDLVRSDQAPASARGNLQPSAPAMRLAVADQVGRVNEPLPLGISVTGSSAGAVVVIAGLAAGTRATAGTPTAAGEWRIPARDLSKALVLPPQDFVGNMNVLVDLKLSDESIADSRVMNLEWKAPVKKGPPLVELPPVQQPQPPAPLALAPPQPMPQAPAVASAAPAAPKVRQLDRDEIATIVKRGEELLTQGDIAGARLLLQRAAEARDPRAALLLGSTYDPATFGRLGVLGFEPDQAQAKAWYKRAAEMGSPDAPARLERLAAHDSAR